jgi:hypothetical protein
MFLQKKQEGECRREYAAQSNQARTLVQRSRRDARHSALRCRDARFGAMRASLRSRQAPRSMPPPQSAGAQQNREGGAPSIEVFAGALKNDINFSPST